MYVSDACDTLSSRLATETQGDSEMIPTSDKRQDEKIGVEIDFEIERRDRNPFPCHKTGTRLGRSTPVRYHAYAAGIYHTTAVRISSSGDHAPPFQSVERTRKGGSLW